MNYVDIIILIILIGGLIVGYSRGFVQSIISFIGYFAAIIIAKIYSPKLAYIFSKNASLKSKLNEFILKRLTSIDIPSTSVPVSNVSSLNNSNLVAQGEKFNSLILNLPFLKEYDISNAVNDSINAMAQNITEMFTQMIYIAISASIIFVLVRIIFSLIGRIVKGILKTTSILDSTDRFLGAILGGLTASVFITLIAVVITPFIFTSSSINLMSNFRESIIMNWIYQSNIFASIVTTGYAYITK